MTRIPPPVRRLRHLTPEERLLVAILKQTLEDEGLMNASPRRLAQALRRAGGARAIIRMDRRGKDD